MKRIWFASAAMLLLTMLSQSGQARPFIDLRSERNDAIDQAAATEPRDHACDARISHSLGHFRFSHCRTQRRSWALVHSRLSDPPNSSRGSIRTTARASRHRPFSAERKITSLQ
jgi:hypothetical protein